MSKQAVEPKDVKKKKRTYALKLTRLEIAHLRDLMSVVLPIDMSETVSVSLAKCKGKVLTETRLWNKIAEKCKETNLALDEQAPDFVVMSISPPQMTVFEVDGDDD